MSGQGLPPAVAERARFAGKATLIVAVLPLFIAVVIVAAGAAEMLGSMLYAMVGWGVVLLVLGALTLRGTWLAPVLSGALLGLYGVGMVGAVILGEASFQMAGFGLACLAGASWMVRVGLEIRRAATGPAGRAPDDVDRRPT